MSERTLGARQLTAELVKLGATTPVHAAGVDDDGKWCTQGWRVLGVREFGDGWAIAMDWGKGQMARLDGAFVEFDDERRKRLADYTAYVQSVEDDYANEGKSVPSRGVFDIVNEIMREIAREVLPRVELFPPLGRFIVRRSDGERFFVFREGPVGKVGRIVGMNAAGERVSPDVWFRDEWRMVPNA